jgi:hypothetical protein
MPRQFHLGFFPSISPSARRAGGIAILLLAAATLPAQDADSSLHRGFLNPPTDARPMMRWWWFGPAVTKPELQKELDTMRGAGIGGVEIQPVYPLMLDDESKGIKNLSYLSPEFLDAVSFANQTARTLGLRVDITLGSGWPYGGPKTTLALAAGRLKVVSLPITSEQVTPPTLAEGESLIASFAVDGPLGSFDPSTARRIDSTGRSSLPTLGNWTALFFIASHTRQTVKRPAYGAEGYVLDHFARAAIDEHLNDVATPLLRAFGNQPPTSVFSDSLEVYGADWTQNLPAEFLKRRGYDLIAHLPYLLANTPQAEAVRHDWGLTLSDLMREKYLAPVRDFAEAHGTQFRSQTYGEPAVTLADEAVPNLPEGEGPQWNAFSFTRWASSASHLYDRNITSAETWTWLHSPAFRATPLDMKAEADRMFLLGVNQIVGHGYPYSPPAAGEPGWSLYAAAVFNSHNPWFPVMPDVMRYLQRVSWLLRQGKPANDIAILLPEDDSQAAFRPGHVSITDEMKKRISTELMSAILDSGYNVDYIDATTIDKLDTIPYPVLIVPPTDRIPLSTYKKIANYGTLSGKVIALAKTPSLGPGFKDEGDSAEIAALSQRIFRQSGHVGVLLNKIGELANALHQALPPDLDAAGKTTGLGFIHRKLLDSDVYFAVNTSNQPIEASIHFRAKRTFIESWDPESGCILQAARTDRLPLTLAPYESRIFVLSNSADQEPMTQCPDVLPPSAQEMKQREDLNDGWQIRFADSEQPQQLKKLVSWTELDERKNFSGEAVYTRSFTIDPLHPLLPASKLLLDFGTGTATVDTRPANAPGMHALLDPPIREAAIIFVNGKRVGSLWHPPYRIDISSFVHPGENRIEVHVYNTAINILSGQPARDYSALNAKYGKRFEPQDMDNLRPIPSGLLGPILLEEQGMQ